MSKPQEAQTILESLGHFPDGVRMIAVGTVTNNFDAVLVDYLFFRKGEEVIPHPGAINEVQFGSVVVRGYHPGVLLSGQQLCLRLLNSSETKDPNQTIVQAGLSQIIGASVSIYRFVDSSAILRSAVVVWPWQQQKPLCERGYLKRITALASALLPSNDEAIVTVLVRYQGQYSTAINEFLLSRRAVRLTDEWEAEVDLLITDDPNDSDSRRAGLVVVIDAGAEEIGPFKNACPANIHFVDNGEDLLTSLSRFISDLLDSRQHCEQCPPVGSYRFTD